MMRVAILQMRSGLDPVRNAQDAVAGVRSAAGDGACIVATPEMTGLLDRDRNRLLATIVEEDDDPTLEAMRKAAQDFGVWIALGSVAVRADAAGRAANRSFMIDPDGAVIARYDKMHLFDAAVCEDEHYRESDTYVAGVADALAEGPSGAVFGLSVCYDLRFPDFYRRLTRKGAEILLAPSAFTVPTGRAHWEILLRARAIECGAYVIAAAQGGLHEDGRRTWGRSMIVGPWGDVVLAARDDAPQVLIADIDMNAIKEARRRIPAWSLECGG